MVVIFGKPFAFDGKGNQICFTHSRNYAAGNENFTYEIAKILCCTDSGVVLILSRMCEKGWNPIKKLLRENSAP